MIFAALVAALAWFAVQAHDAGWVSIGPLYTVLTGEPPPTQPSGPSYAGTASRRAGEPARLRLATWNIANMGRSKDAADIALMADVLAPAANLVAVQEVVVSEAGDDAVVRLRDALRARGAPWEYTLSNPTSGRGSERYAFLWRADRVAPQGTCWLDGGLEADVDREPFLCRFAAVGAARTEPVLVATFHAVPTSRDPERENVLLDRLHAAYPADDLVIAGDFNLPAEHAAFDGLRAAGFAAALPEGTRTTLKAVVSPSGEHLASAYDNVFYEPAELTPVATAALDFSGRLPTLRDARNVSDHLPVVVAFLWE